jgi:hypothetical protein
MTNVFSDSELLKHRTKMVGLELVRPPMNKSALAFLSVLALFVIGCPYNRYEITMRPRGDAIERELVFFRQDTQPSSSGDPHYQPFDSNELAAITALYPANGIIMNVGERHTAKGVFAGELPHDIGGSGHYRRLETSMGAAGFYLERFRGSADPAGVLEKRYQALDQLADLVIGWSYEYFGREANYQELRQFLDQDFRHDLKNFSLYLWTTDSVNGGDDLLNVERGAIRFGQYAIERNYVNIDDAAGLIWGKAGMDDRIFCNVAQRLIVQKLGVAEGRPVPQNLAFLADPGRLQDSWKDYLAGTDAYRAKLRIWENAKLTDPDAEKPKPDSVVDDLVDASMAAKSDGGGDRIIVRLSLASEPLDTNGKWDGEHKQVAWDSRLPAEDRPSAICYADWVEPQEDFQKEHLGGVRLRGQNLLNYCFWRTNLDEKKAAEWEQFLARLYPGSDSNEQLSNFKFVGEPVQIDSKAPKRLSDIGRELIQFALREK